MDERVPYCQEKGGGELPLIAAAESGERENENGNEKEEEEYVSLGREEQMGGWVEGVKGLLE